MKGFDQREHSDVDQGSEFQQHGCAPDPSHTPDLAVCEYHSRSFYPRRENAVSATPFQVPPSRKVLVIQLHQGRCLRDEWGIGRAARTDGPHALRNTSQCKIHAMGEPESAIATIPSLPCFGCQDRKSTLHTIKTGWKPLIVPKEMFLFRRITRRRSFCTISEFSSASRIEVRLGGLMSQITMACRPSGVVEPTLRP